MLKNTCTKMEKIGRALNTDVEVGIREVGTLHWEGGRYEGEREGKRDLLSEHPCLSSPSSWERPHPKKHNRVAGDG
jgi:hypothetical protein